MSLHTADERSVLEGLLDVQRAEIALLLDEVDEAEARTRLVPSATTVLGLVQHAVYNLLMMHPIMCQLIFFGDDEYFQSTQ